MPLSCIFSLAKDDLYDQNRIPELLEFNGWYVDFNLVIVLSSFDDDDDDDDDETFMDATAPFLSLLRYVEALFFLAMVDFFFFDITFSCDCCCEACSVSAERTNDRWDLGNWAPVIHGCCNASLTLNRKISGWRSYLCSPRAETDIGKAHARARHAILQRGPMS